METKEEFKTIKKISDRGKVHFVLSHSYLIFLFAVVFGVLFDIIIPLKAFDIKSYQYVGVIMIILGTVIIYWAQSTSSFIKKKKDKEKVHPGFHYGPYRYSRSPTHLGLFIMTLGLAIVISSPFSILFVIIAQIITKLFFLKEEEKLLEKKYGDIYCSYKYKNKNQI